MSALVDAPTLALLQGKESLLESLSRLAYRTTLESTDAMSFLPHKPQEVHHWLCEPQFLHPSGSVALHTALYGQTGGPQRDLGSLASEAI